MEVIVQSLGQYFIVTDILMVQDSMTESSDVIGMQDLLKGDSMEEAKLVDRYC